MPIETCEHCGRDTHWIWEEAFEKFGFNDGDGPIETLQVSDCLTDAGYQVKDIQWGIHNKVICSIVDQYGKELMADETVTYGYDCPRSYLPSAIIKLLDEALPA